ncbi:MAG: TlpA family protein disulfide reductase [Holophagaceae bacterium]|nr:TlpA family protein disulfide reductase [Holophagaceae bacterium]
MSSIQKTLSLIGVAIALMCAVALHSKSKKTLKVGSVAPQLQVSRWVKGDGPTSLERGNVYVVEFWATWCPPCRESIPHLTEMARHYKDKATFIGVSVWEHGSGSAVEENVDSFVKGMGNRMDYLVARDDGIGFMAKNWLSAAGVKGIPSAFVVDRRGKIAWVGHPMGPLGKAVDKALAGT